MWQVVEQFPYSSLAIALALPTQSVGYRQLRGLTLTKRPTGCPQRHLMMIMIILYITIIITTNRYGHKPINCVWVHALLHDPREYSLGGCMPPIAMYAPIHCG